MSKVIQSENKRRLEGGLGGLETITDGNLAVELMTSQYGGGQITTPFDRTTRDPVDPVDRVCVCGLCTAFA